MSSSKAINYGSCFLCGDAGNLWKVDCRWLDYPCVLGCPDTMKVRWSGQEHTKGLRFLRCNSAPRCNGYKWIDVPTKAKGKAVEVEVERNEVKNKEKSKEEGKLKLCIDGVIKMNIEGNVSDVTELVRKLAF
ncbi:hypothetical protein IFM89_013097 [Coptis chinensis]|uniref:Zinc finger GRF-type domain-containing protein n=1 Tax=Coptis chinensis TaxID=261450 RepID=A0A835IK76_9MAGN|nr:hypothetical protein IFM89_013097 [Coptis chinensis]